MAHKIYGQNVTIIKSESADPLAGTWVFNDTPIFNIGTVTFDLLFTSNGVNFTSIKLTPYTISPPEPLPVMSYDATTIYNSFAIWANEAYKTITITSKLSEVTNGDNLLAWLQANATKQ